VQCPYCDFEDTKVIDSRLAEGKDAIRRRRECLSCEKRFTTYERREPLRLMVLKRDGTREPFDREKLCAGLTKACAKRPVSEEQIEAMVDEIEAELRERRRHEATSRRLGDMVLGALEEAGHGRVPQVRLGIQAVYGRGPVPLRAGETRGLGQVASPDGRRGTGRRNSSQGTSRQLESG
jgi:transcriptional repressor NrdR